MGPKAKKTITELASEDKDLVYEMVKNTVQEVLEAQMTELLGASKGERSGDRSGYRSGYYERGLTTRVGKLELRVPQDRDGRFSTQLFERYQRSEKALVTAMMEMYVKGVSTRKVTAVTEELCGQSFSASTISRLNARLDASLQRFFERRLEDVYPYLIVDARYERVRENGVVRRRAVLVAIGVNWEGHRCVLGTELANRESQSSWTEFLSGLKARGLSGVELVVSDSHEGLKKAIMAVFPESVWQRCYVHFLRNALDHLPRKGDHDCLTELRWLYDRRDVTEAQRDLSAWLAKWETKYPKLCDWVELNIGETFTFYRLPFQHHKHMRSTNMLERVNEEIKRRTHIVRIFPNAASCLRLVRALTIETHEVWQEGSRYLNMALLQEQKKEELRRLSEAA
ncbi:MAG: IS256 family transposase [Myxococcales bacterium]|nr:IS256 family transposase [Myxococcales bacterium]